MAVGSPPDSIHPAGHTAIPSGGLLLWETRVSEQGFSKPFHVVAHDTPNIFANEKQNILISMSGN